MAQGKLKVKSKLPENVKSRKHRKGNAVTKRSNCPIQSKGKGREDIKKIKNIITKSVNKAVEEEIRARVAGSKKNLSKAQQAVADHHSKASASSAK